MKNGSKNKSSQVAGAQTEAHARKETMEFPLLALRCVRGLVELRLVRVGGEERREERDAGRGERAGWGWVGWGRRGGEL